MMALKVLYIAVCLSGVGAIFMLQRYRYRFSKGCRWWLYSALALGLLYEAFEAAKFGVPGWPASRWLTTPAMAAVLWWAAFDDWRKRWTF